MVLAQPATRCTVGDVSLVTLSSFCMLMYQAHDETPAVVLIKVFGRGGNIMFLLLFSLCFFNLVLVFYMFILKGKEEMTNLTLRFKMFKRALFSE